MEVGKDARMCDKGTTMMFVGIVAQENDSVRIWDLNTNRVVMSQDVIWLKQMYFQQDDTIGELECI